MPPRTKKRSMSQEHKAALAEGRNLSRSVGRYLEALEAHKPKRGRKRTPDSIKKRLERIDQDLPTADALSRLHLVQERMDLENELTSMQAGQDLSELEAEFVSAAKTYGERKGISYSAWREAGVEPSVLKRAGISRAG